MPIAPTPGSNAGSLFNSTTGAPGGGSELALISLFAWLFAVTWRVLEREDFTLLPGLSFAPSTPPA
jgi:hypothetical protein